jgi:hypothetical protein
MPTKAVVNNTVRLVCKVLIDATPDHLAIQMGNMILFAQILVKPLNARLRSAEYSKKPLLCGQEQ